MTLPPNVFSPLAVSPGRAALSVDEGPGQGGLAAATVPVLQISGVHKRYGLLRPHEALRGVSIVVERGECYGLAGPNGAGKTSLIRIMLGLARPDAGIVRLFGLSPEDPEVRRRVGFVPEAAELPVGATPRTLVPRWVRLRGLGKHHLPRGLEQMDRLGLGPILDRPLQKFSKGERQRTLLALALIGDPELLVLDEPTDGVDPMGRALVRRVLHEERAAGKTVFLNSHLLSETERICSRVGFLRRGQLVREERLRGSIAAASASALDSTLVVLDRAPPSGALPPGLRAPTPAELSPLDAEGRAGVLYLMEHQGLPALNAALDGLRGAGALLVEVRAQRKDLEASFALAAATDDDAVQLAPPPVLELDPPPVAPGRALRASIRMAQELVADLAARKVGWMALAFACLLVGTMAFFVRQPYVVGAAAMSKEVESPAALHLIGTVLSQMVYWVLLTVNLFVAALFAPTILEPRRSVLLLAQPVSRADLATGLYLSTCSAAAGSALFLSVLLVVAMRSLGVPIPFTALLLFVPVLCSFASLYVVVLAINHFARSGLIAAILGEGLILGLLMVQGYLERELHGGVSLKAFLLRLLPPIGPIGQTFAAFVTGQGGSLLPFAAALAFAAAGLWILRLAVARSER